jgi:hypothetical protein
VYLCTRTSPSIVGLRSAVLLRSLANNGIASAPNRQWVGFVRAGVCVVSTTGESTLHFKITYRRVGPWASTPRSAVQIDRDSLFL